MAFAKRQLAAHWSGKQSYLKDRIPANICSSVVYKFKCSSCQATYYGKTSCHFIVRCREHLGINKKGISIKGASLSIRDHLTVCPGWEKIDVRVFYFEPAKVIFQLHISYITRCKKPDVKISMRSGDAALQSCKFHKT